MQNTKAGLKNFASVALPVLDTLLAYATGIWNYWKSGVRLVHR